ncbi:bifunctional methylenetetrahydrofolate dehydrogenase/methenyltetrahydrofolate cyclohydrolase FolD [bacterium]|nr:bifunctional methylenetetrahydrofolate dehydrogenase/methenyltetrahydrofolate cyclohydrolase FolD [candidate division CSSED10-310 bacterium]
MEAKCLSGKETAKQLTQRIQQRVHSFASRENRVPKLAVILVGDDPASAVYVRSKHKLSSKIGIDFELHTLPDTISQKELLEIIRTLNDDSRCDAILVQLPLPPHIDSNTVLLAIDPIKDVDCFHPENIGRLWTKTGVIAPCTPAGIMELLRSYNIPIEGKHAIVIGRSNIVGKPMAALLLHVNATITIAHSKTKNLSNLCRTADILVAAIGKPAFVTSDFIKPGAVVIDVGMNRIDSVDADSCWFQPESPIKDSLEQKGHALIGDVHPNDVRSVASWYTPVPGGVGPMTVAMLMENTVSLAEYRNRRQ